MRLGFAGGAFSVSRDGGLQVEMVREGLREAGGEWFAASVSPRSEDVRINYKAPRGAGVVHA
ncbi:MAG TPA: hypothetical protein VF887_03150 [Gemmatimonadaceae bacterium]